jgi:hypothetical protein
MGEAAAHAFFSASLSLLAGFLFVHTSYYQRYCAASLKPERLALYLLGWSFAAYVCGEVLAVLTPVDLTPARLVSARDDLYKAGITAPVLNSIWLAVLCGLGDNIRCQFLMRRDVERYSRGDIIEDWRIGAAARFVRKSTNWALRVMFRATVLQKPLLITLKSHKVYVGKPFVNPWEDPTKDLTYIKILPVASGYRDPTTKKVTLVTKYKELSETLVELEAGPASDDLEVLDQQDDPTDPLAEDIFGLVDGNRNITARVDVNDIGIVLSWQEVESLMIFNEDLYKAFQAHGPAAPAAA